MSYYWRPKRDRANFGLNALSTGEQLKCCTQVCSPSNSIRSSSAFCSFCLLHKLWITKHFFNLKPFDLRSTVDVLFPPLSLPLPSSPSTWLCVGWQSLCSISPDLSRTFSTLSAALAVSLRPFSPSTSTRKVLYTAHRPTCNCCTSPSTEHYR